jgi:hypothetical protein
MLRAAVSSRTGPAFSSACEADGGSTASRPEASLAGFRSEPARNNFVAAISERLGDETSDSVGRNRRSPWVPLQPRQDQIPANGKREMQNYWLDLGAGAGGANDHNSDLILSVRSLMSCNEGRRLPSDDLADDKLGA